MALNGFAHVRTFNVAAGTTPGRLLLSDAGADDQACVVPGERGIAVESVRLDDLPGVGERPIALLKIDVEGYEKPVLEGASRVLASTGVLYVESWEQHFGRYGYRTSDVIGLLLAHGFRCLSASVDGGYREVGAEHVSLSCENLVAVRDLEAFVDRTGYPVAVAAGRDRPGTPPVPPRSPGEGGR